MTKQDQHSPANLLKIIEQNGNNYRAALRKMRELSDENTDLATHLNNAMIENAGLIQQIRELS